MKGHTYSKRNEAHTPEKVMGIETRSFRAAWWIPRAAHHMVHINEPNRANGGSSGQHHLAKMLRQLPRGQR